MLLHNQHWDDAVLSKVIHHDIKRFGLIPELLGRLPVLTYLKPLTLDMMTRILQEPKNALLKQYIKLFELEDISLTFEKEAIEFIASQAMDFGLGARGLRSICEEVLTDAMFTLPSDETTKEFKITKEYAQKQLSSSKFSQLKVA